MDILYFCPHRIIPPKGIAGDSHLAKTAPEVNLFYKEYK